MEFIEKKHIITFNGESGTGKSFIKKRVAKTFSMYSCHSTGDTVRQMAREAGIPFEEFNAYHAKHGTSFDEIIDGELKRISQEEDHYLIDARLGACFIPNSFKVLIKADRVIRARRRLKHFLENDFEQYKHTTAAQVLSDLDKRDRENNERYEKKYGFSVNDESKYDLVIDNNGDNIIEEVFHTIWYDYNEWLKQPVFQV